MADATPILTNSFVVKALTSIISVLVITFSTIMFNKISSVDDRLGDLQSDVRALLVAQGINQTEINDINTRLNRGKICLTYPPISTPLIPPIKPKLVDRVFINPKDLNDNKFKL